MNIEILDCLKRKRDICVKAVITSQNTAFMLTPALRKEKSVHRRPHQKQLLWEFSHDSFSVPNDTRSKTILCYNKIRDFPFSPLFCIFYLQKQDIILGNQETRALITVLKIERYGKGRSTLRNGTYGGSGWWAHVWFPVNTYQACFQIRPQGWLLRHTIMQSDPPVRRIGTPVVLAQR